MLQLLAFATLRIDAGLFSLQRLFNDSGLIILLHLFDEVSEQFLHFSALLRFAVQERAAIQTLAVCLGQEAILLPSGHGIFPCDLLLASTFDRLVELWRVN